MANKLGINNLFNIFEGMNAFGASPDARTKSLLDAEFITPETVEAANRRSIGTGIVTGLANYLAMPKNQGFGSGIPYIAQSYLAANKSAQAPFQRIGDKYAMDTQIKEQQRILGERNRTKDAIIKFTENNPGHEALLNMPQENALGIIQEFYKTRNAPKKAPNYGALVASKSQQLYGKVPTELTQEEFTEVNEAVKEDKIDLVKQEGGAKAQGSAMVAFNESLQANGDVAIDRVEDLNQLEALLANVPDGGFGEETFTKYAGALQNLGFIEDDLIGNKQASIAVSNRLAKALRKAGEGVMTDADFRVLKESVPGLGQSPEGRKILIDAIRKTSQRQIEIARMANEYVRKNGILDAEFRYQLKNYQRSNPVFSKEYLDNLKNTYSSGTKVETDKKTINKEDQDLLDKYL